MPACHAAHVSIEEIDAWRPSTQTVTSNATKALLEQWCDYELRWVACDDRNAPSLWGRVQWTCSRVPGSLVVVRGTARKETERSGLCGDMRPDDHDAGRHP